VNGDARSLKLPLGGAKHSAVQLCVWCRATAVRPHRGRCCVAGVHLLLTVSCCNGVLLLRWLAAHALHTGPDRKSRTWCTGAEAADASALPQKACCCWSYRHDAAVLVCAHKELTAHRHCTCLTVTVTDVLLLTCLVCLVQLAHVSKGVSSCQQPTLQLVERCLRARMRVSAIVDLAPNGSCFASTALKAHREWQLLCIYCFESSQRNTRMMHRVQLLTFGSAKSLKG
jgi:hypothetical protein